MHRPTGTTDLIGQPLRLTALAQWKLGESPESTTTLGTLYPLTSLQLAPLAPALLVLPSDYRETAWPGYRAVPPGTTEASGRWRTLQTAQR